MKKTFTRTRKIISMLMVMAMLVSLFVSVPVFATDTASKIATHMVVSPKGGSDGARISWKNPASSTLTKTEVYRIDNIETAPTYTKIATDENPVAGEYTKAEDTFTTAYTADTNKKLYYKVVCTFEDGTSYEVMNYSNTAFYDWSTLGNKPIFESGKYRVNLYANNTNYVPAVKAELDWDVKSEEGPSIHMASSLQSGSNNYVLDCMLNSDPAVDSYVKISFKYKTEGLNATTHVLVNGIYGSNNTVGKHEIKNFTGTNDWTEYSTVKKYGGTGGFVEFIVGTAGDIWIDDLRVYSCDEEGNVTDTTNLVTSPDEYFTESYYTTNPAPAAPVVSDTEERDGGVDISWGAVANATGYEVYEKSGDAYYLRASVPAEITTVQINNLTNNTAYDFVVKAMDATTKSSAFSAVSTLTPQPDPFAVSAYETVVDAGNLTVSANMKNGTYTDGLSARLVLAIYKNGTGTVLSMSNVALGTAQSIALSETKPVSATITLPNDYTAEAYTIKAFLWDGMTSMKPYIGAETITVPAN